MAIYVERGISERMVIRFQFSREEVEKIKLIKGHRWDPNCRIWTLPDTEESLNELFALFGQRDIKVLNFSQHMC